MCRGEGFIYTPSLFIGPPFHSGGIFGANQIPLDRNAASNSTASPQPQSALRQRQRGRGEHKASSAERVIRSYEKRGRVSRGERICGHSLSALPFWFTFSDIGGQRCSQAYCALAPASYGSGNPISSHTPCPSATDFGNLALQTPYLSMAIASGRPLLIQITASASLILPFCSLREPLLYGRVAQHD